MTQFPFEIDETRLLDLERAMIRIPSPTFEEGPLADFLAAYLREMGLSVEMMEVLHPAIPGKTTRQVIARLAGNGGGPTLMLNGHMDPTVSMTGWTVDPFEAKYENGWIWGAGAHDDKGGLAAAICAIDAVVRSGVVLKGTVLLCAVASHKLGKVGTRALLDHGIKADFCINIEHSTNTIATVVNGSVRIKLVTRNNGVFFRYSPEAHAAYFNAIEQQAEIMRRLGPSVAPADEKSWMRFTPHPDLPGFPMHRFDRIHKDHYGRECEMHMQIRTVPGQTIEGIREDLQRVLDDIKADYPTFDCAMTIPADGPGDLQFVAPSEMPRNHPLVAALAEGQRLASGCDPLIGGGLRIGNVGDGNILAAAGIPSVQYGPGDLRIYEEWPCADERVEFRELVETARAMAYAIARCCS